MVASWQRRLRNSVGFLFLILLLGAAVVGCELRPTEVPPQVSPTRETCIEIEDMIEIKPEAFRYDSQRDIYEILVEAIEATPSPWWTPEPRFTPEPEIHPHVHPHIEHIEIPDPDDDPEMQLKLQQLLGPQYENRFSTERIEIADGPTLKVRGTLCGDVLSVYESADLLVQ